MTLKYSKYFIRKIHEPYLVLNLNDVISVNVQREGVIGFSPQSNLILLFCTQATEQNFIRMK